MKKALSLVSVAAGLLFASLNASAASVSYYLDQSNDLPDGVNYATVTISDSVDYVGDIEFEVVINTGVFPQPLSNFGMQTFLFNFDSALTVDSGNIVDLDPSDWDINMDKNAGGGFGKFEFQFMGDGNSRTEVLTFRITGVTGDTIESYAMPADMLNNGSDEFFAAHIAGYDDATSGNTSGQFAGSTLVPIPAAVWMFGSALGALGWFRRKAL